MNCVKHPNKPAVAICVDCGCGLCYDCANKYREIYICTRCANARISANDEKEISREKKCYKRDMLCIRGYFILLVVAGLIDLNFVTNGGRNIIYGSLPFLIFVIVFLPTLPWGWRTISDMMAKHQPKHVYWVSWPLIVIGYYFKFIGSLLIGPFITPSLMKRAIKSVKEYRKKYSK